MKSEKSIREFQGTKKEAQKLGAFYTPMEIAREMAAKIPEVVGKTVLDPACGYGNLIVAVLDRKVADGEDPSQALTEVFGNELERKNLEICLQNLRRWADDNNASWDDKLMRTHFHCGDALTEFAYDFSECDSDFVNHVEIIDENDTILVRIVSNSIILKEVTFDKKIHQEQFKEFVNRAKKKGLKFIKC